MDLLFTESKGRAFFGFTEIQHAQILHHDSSIRMTALTQQQVTQLVRDDVAQHHRF